MMRTISLAVIQTKQNVILHLKQKKQKKEAGRKKYYDVISIREYFVPQSCDKYYPTNRSSLSISTYILNL